MTTPEHSDQTGDTVARTPRTATIRELRADGHSLMERLPGMVYQCRNDPDWTLEMVSAGARKLTGYPPAELLGPGEPTYDSLIHPQDREAVRARVIEAVDDGRPFDLVYRITTAGGEEKLVWEMGHPVYDDDGELLCLEGFIADPSDRIEVAEELRHSQRLESLGTLAAEVAHDLKNVLSVVLANVEELERWLPDDATEPREWMADARKMALHGGELLSKLLAFGRREDLNVKPLDLSRHLPEMAATLSRVLPDSVNVSLDLDDRPLPPVLVDESAVEQVLLNLATNARDAMPGGGRLKLRAWPVRLTDEDRARYEWIRPGAYVSVSLSDTGTGMTDETRRRIFEPFYTTKERGEGSGLGMAMAYGLVKQLHGYLHVYSELGRGTTVRVYLPAAEGAAAAENGFEAEEGLEAETTAAAPARTGGPNAEDLPEGSGTILVVEDEPALGRALKRALERLGYGARVAVNGREALERLGKPGHGIDLVLTDVILPELTGVELHDRVRKLDAPGASDLPFVFASGYAAADLTGDLALPPGAAFLNKPWTVGELARAVKGGLEG